MSSLSNTRPAEVLLVEDSPTDVLIARAALEEARVLISLHVVVDGVAAMDFLHRRGNYPDAPRPDLILLDLNLPKKDGREVLSEIKQDDSLKLIPVVILTTSKAEEDVLRTYGLHVNCYLVKPVSFEDFAAMVRSMGHFWFSVVTLPGKL